jgi:hypothetical protein
MAAITLLTAGPQERSGASTPVDVSAYSTLRLNVRVAANRGHISNPTVRLYIESGPSSSGPWSTVWEQVYNSHEWPNDKRVVLGALDAFARVRWVARGASEAVKTYGNPSEDPGLPDLGLVFGIAGDAL